MRRARLGSLFLVALGLPMLTADVAAQAAPVQVQVPLLFKVLAFDRNRSRPDGLVLGVVYQSHYRGSELVKDEAVEAAQRQGGGTVRVVTIDLDAGDFGAALDRARPDVVYLAPLRAVRIADLVSGTRERRIVTTTGVTEYARDGVAVAVGLRGDRPEIVVNLSAARAEGSDYSAQLLKLSRVVGPEAPK